MSSRPGVYGRYSCYCRSLCVYGQECMVGRVVIVDHCVCTAKSVWYVELLLSIIVCARPGVYGRWSCYCRSLCVHGQECMVGRVVIVDHCVCTARSLR